ncbi:MAG: hypothetical protein LW836_05370 [Gemmatimonadetes bacterium]|nr:hypothetical protein [Gemmatimonadota bacterium]
MHSVAEAVARIVEGIAPLAVESVGLGEALGRVLAADVRSPITLPHWANSAMDGYAVRGVDIAGARAESPVTLPVLETIAAGAFPTRALGAGEATRIMTGGSHRGDHRASRGDAARRGPDRRTRFDRAGQRRGAPPSVRRDPRFR